MPDSGAHQTLFCISHTALLADVGRIEVTVVEFLGGILCELLVFFFFIFRLNIYTASVVS